MGSRGSCFVDWEIADWSCWYCGLKGYEMSVEVILMGHALGLFVLFPLGVAGFQ